MDADVVVVGGGKSGLAAARGAARAGASVVLLEKSDRAPATGHAEVRSGMVAIDVLLDARGRVAGVATASGRSASYVRAGAVVLATGGVAGLWDAAFPRATGDALALAHRAGASFHRLAELRFDEGRVWIRGGVAVDRRGRTSVPGLHACGAAVGGDVGGLVAGEDAAARSEPARSVETPEFPDLDAPLPPGFADVKLDRLRGVMRTHLPPSGSRDPATALRLLHALKGEADDFARARVDAGLFELRSACEAALLVATAASRPDAKRRGELAEERDRG